MSRWPDRPGYLVLWAVVGAVAAAAVILIVVLMRDGDDDGDRQAVATTTARTTPAGTPTSAATPPMTEAATPTPGPAATATPAGFQDPDEALAAFVEEELNRQYVGDCDGLDPGEGPPSGICSQELYRSEELATFMLVLPASECCGEAVLTRHEDGTWSVNYVSFPPLGETIAVGSEAVVIGAGSCLRFREVPSASAEVLSCQIDGARALVVEGPVDADDHTWWRLEGLGWASGQYLASVAE